MPSVPSPPIATTPSSAELARRSSSRSTPPSSRKRVVARGAEDRPAAREDPGDRAPGRAGSRRLRRGPASRRGRPARRGPRATRPRTIARIAAFRPGQSPPPVRTPKRLRPRSTTPVGPWRLTSPVLDLVRAGDSGRSRPCPYAATGSLAHGLAGMAGVAELADARDSKSRVPRDVWVRPPPPACVEPRRARPGRRVRFCLRRRREHRYLPGAGCAGAHSVNRG